MNLGYLLEVVGGVCDLSPQQSPTALKRQKNFVNLAITELAAKAPYLFRSDERRYTVPGSLRPTGAETFNVDSDAWLLKLNTLDATAIAQWRLDGTHATQSIYLKDSAGVKHRRIIQGVALIGGYIYVTLTQPWANATDTGLTWEVLSEDFYLPKDLKSITAVRLADKANTWHRDITLIGEHSGRANGAGIVNRITSGNPWSAYPGGDVYIPAPAAATAAVSADAGAFSSYPAATFEYTLTIAWGSRPEGLPRPAQHASTTKRAIPLIESSPSAVVSATPSTGNKVTLTLPDIRRDVAMSTGTRSNADLVGYYICVYRAESGKQPKLWQTVPAGTTTVDDDGTTIPDYFHTIPREGGARSLTFDAIPADQIIVDGVWIPPVVVNNVDDLMVDQTGGLALVELTAERVYRKLNNPGEANASRARFLAILSDMNNEQGSGEDPSIPHRRRTKRVGGNWQIGPRHSVDYDWGN